MKALPLSLFSSPLLMKNIFTSLVAVWFCAGIWSQVEVGTSPLEYNTDKYFQSHDSYIHRQTKSLYPACGSNFYLYDTLSLPFVDDFSKNHFTTYHSWDWPTSFDSIATVYRLTPDTFAADTQPLKYSLYPTRHYSYVNDTVDLIDSSIANVARQLILYGDCNNPFIPVDTLTIWAITSPKYYWDTLTLHVLSTLISTDGMLYGDTLDTIRVYLPPPNNNYWVDNFAYRNTSMGVDPPTYGVVTFDGTNEFGEPYSPGGTNSYGVADYLTSKPINLAGYTAADNIYLSFFSQPKGLGYRPDTHDSLVVEFYSPATEKWYHQWGSIGDTLVGDTCRAFLQTVLPVNNPLFFQNGFQFRFKNWGNLSGNLDHWNIDYVRLDTNRTATDTLIQDVAFVIMPPTILNNYTSMPAHQFLMLNKKPKWNNYLSNLYNANKFITYGFDFRNEAGTLLNQCPTDYPAPDVADIITPYHPNGYSTFPGWAEPDFNHDFTTALPTCCPFVDTARFTISHYFTCSTTDVNHENDSIVLKQDFINYYSYDDGTAEQALWLGTPGYMAVKFTANFADTLRAIQYYFSPVKEDVTSRYITLQVYTDLNSAPIYQESRQIGVLDADPMGHVNKINNGFTTFILNDSVILPAGDFYVGWYQSQTFKVNVGFDKNLDNKSRTYFRTSGAWDTLSIPGTLMIRPVVGKTLWKDQIGIEENWNDQSILLYPNPASETIYFTLADDVTLTSVRVIDITGKQVYQATNPTTHQVDIAGFAQGLYFMQFFANGSAQPLTKKFIIHR
jgi:hypothetical protein